MLLEIISIILLKLDCFGWILENFVAGKIHSRPELLVSGHTRMTLGHTRMRWPVGEKGRALYAPYAGPVRRQQVVRVWRDAIRVWVKEMKC